MRMRIGLHAAITVRITLIHNTGAGRQGADDARKLVRFLEEHGYEVRYQSAKEEDWKKALKKPADMVVVAGGDGTVAKVTRRMVGRGIPVGLLERPVEELGRGWQGGRRVKLDVGVTKGPWGERYFVEGVGAGVFASLLTKPSNPKLKKRKKAVEGGMQRLPELDER